MLKTVFWLKIIFKVRIKDKIKFANLDNHGDKIYSFF